MYFYDETPRIWETHADALLVLEQAEARIKEHGQLTIQDWDLLNGFPSSPLMSYRGWRNLTHAEVRENNGGWIIKLPKPIDL